MGHLLVSGRGLGEVGATSVVAFTDGKPVPTFPENASSKITELRMAELVAGIGVPHSPHYPAQIAKDGPEQTARLFREVKAHLDATCADAIVVIANDHFNTFILKN